MKFKEVTTKFSIRISSKTNDVLEKICLTRRGVTKTQIIQAALEEYLFPEGADKKEAEIARYLKRMEAKIKHIERGNEILGETLSVFVRAWLTNTHEVPASQKEAAEIQGGLRYRKFLNALSKRLQSGKCLFAELPEDVLEVAGTAEFYEADEVFEQEIEAT